MQLSIKRFVSASVMSTVIVLGTIGSAAAAPKKGQVLDLTCDATTTQVIVRGNGWFTPVHDTSDGSHFTPTWFGDYSETEYDADGNVVSHTSEEGDDPKGQSGKNKDVVDCTFRFEEELPEGHTLVGEGEVQGYWSQ